MNYWWQEKNFNSGGTSDNDQVSKIGKLGLIDGNLVVSATKFPLWWPSFFTIFWKYMIQTSYQKSLGSKLVFHSNSFLCKRRCLYLQKSSDSEMFCDQKKLGRYDDQVSAMMTKFFLKCMKNTWFKLNCICQIFTLKKYLTVQEMVLLSQKITTKLKITWSLSWPFFQKMETWSW